MRCTGKRAWVPSMARLATGGAGMTYCMRWLSHPRAAAGRACSDPPRPMASSCAARAGETGQRVRRLAGMTSRLPRMEDGGGAGAGAEALGEDAIDGECAGAAHDQRDGEREGEQVVLVALAGLTAEPVHEEADVDVGGEDGPEH